MSTGPERNAAKAAASERPQPTDLSVTEAGVSAKPAPSKSLAKGAEGRARKGQGKRKHAEIRTLPHAAPARTAYGRKPLTDALRKRRSKQRRKRASAIGLSIGIPTLLAVIYYGFVASAQYESVSTFTVQSADGRAASGIEQLIGSLPGGSASQDVLVVRDYTLSRDMLKFLIDEEGWKEHYQRAEADFLARLASDATSEEVYEDYLERVEVTHDTSSDALTMRLRAFTAADADRFSRAILGRSEAAVNRLAEKAREDAISFAKREVEGARARVGIARTNLLKMQGEDAEFNPVQSATAVQGLRAEMEGQLASKRAKLNAMGSFMNPNAPQVVELRQQVRSLQREADRQRKRLVDPSGDDSMNATIAKYEPALFEKEFAERALQSALTSLELARVDASRQHRYLVTIAQPSYPDAPTHPRRLLGILTVLLLSLGIASIGALILATVREHSRA